MVSMELLQQVGKSEQSFCNKYKVYNVNTVTNEP